MSNKNRINKYFCHFEREFVKIKSIDDIMFKKILIYTMLDALSISYAPYIGENKNNNRKRFIILINDLGDWEDCNKVSLPQLLYYIDFIEREIEKKEKENQKKNGKGVKNDNLKSPSREFVEKVKELLGMWDPDAGDVFYLDKDPTLKELKKIAKTELDSKVIKKSRHVELFYDYRNSFIHEFRDPSKGMEYEEDYPYYMTYLNTYDWNLVYPISFFERIARNVLDGLREKFLANDFDPYSAYNFDPHWKFS